METKREIRKHLLKQREAFLPELCEEQSLEVRLQLMEHPVFHSCKTLFSYVSFRNEIDTIAIIEKALSLGKQVAVPRVEGKEMRFYRMECLEDLKPSRFGILEPVDGAMIAEPEDGDLMLVPGSAFDKDGYRIGYGGGYYDKYLLKYPKVYTIGLCYDFQVLDFLPTEPYDLAVKEVLFPKEG